MKCKVILAMSLSENSAGLPSFSLICTAILATKKLRSGIYWTWRGDDFHGYLGHEEIVQWYILNVSKWCMLGLQGTSRSRFVISSPTKALADTSEYPSNERSGSPINSRKEELKMRKSQITKHTRLKIFCIQFLNIWQSTFTRNSELCLFQIVHTGGKP